MRLVTIADSSGGRPGLVIGERIFDLRVGHPSQELSRWRPDSVVGILDAGEEGLEFLSNLRGALEEDPDDSQLRGAWLELGTTDLGPPIRRPGLLLSVHFDATDGWVPLIKSPNALTGTRGVVPASSHGQEELAVRGQLAIVIGKRCQGVTSAEADRFIGGLTLAMDINHHTVKWPSERAGDIWVRHLGGQQPGFYPLGPFLRVGNTIPDSSEPFRLDVNSAVGDTWSLGDLPLTAAEVVATVSMYFPLKPGDVISLAPPNATSLTCNPGDTVTLDQPFLGQLATSIASA